MSDANAKTAQKNRYSVGHTQKRFILEISESIHYPLSCSDISPVKAWRQKTPKGVYPCLIRLFVPLIVEEKRAFR